MMKLVSSGVIALSFLAMSSAPVIAGQPSCVGSCNENDEVTVDEIILMVNIALGEGNVSACAFGDGDSSGSITVDEILTAVNNALEGCGPVGGALGTRRFEIDPLLSTITAALAPGFELSLGTFRGQNDGQAGNAFLEFKAGEPDPTTGIATVDITDASDYIYAEASIANITFCLKPIVPVTLAGIIDCDGGLDLSIGTYVDHVVGRVGEDGFDLAMCKAAAGRVESPNQICAVGQVGGECFLNSDCDSTTGAGDGVCGLAPGLCAGGGLLSAANPCSSEADCEDGAACEPVECTMGKTGDPCRNAGDCDTAAGADDGVCGRPEAHPGACNGPVSFPQVGGDSGPGALSIIPRSDLGLQGLPLELSIESALPCGDEGVVAAQAFAVTTGKARTTVENFSGGNTSLVFDQEGANLSCDNFSTGTGGRFVFGFPTLHLSPMGGGDLVIGFTFQGL